MKMIISGFLIAVILTIAYPFVGSTETQIAGQVTTKVEQIFDQLQN